MPKITGHRQYHGHNFPNLRFPKKGKDIKQHVSVMIDEFVAKIEERKKRISGFAKEMGLDTSMDVLLNMENLDGRYTSSGGDDITVGNSAALRSELGAIQTQTIDVERLKLIVNNLPDDEMFQLDFQELEYFGF